MKILSSLSKKYFVKRWFFVYINNSSQFYGLHF